MNWNAEVMEQLKLLLEISDKQMALMDQLREERDKCRKQRRIDLLLLRQIRVEQTRIAILAELQRRDLEEDLARVKKLSREYESFRETTQ